MSWFSCHTAWLYRETKDLSNSSIYKERFQFIDRTLISSGDIIVHKEKTTYHPILIVYPDATPYIPPTIYTLKASLDEETARQLSALPPNEIGGKVQDKVTFSERRHQNMDGSICFLEAGDLHSENAEAYPVKEILKRIRTWLAGRIPKDSPEVELFNHFRQRSNELQYLLPAPFFDTEIVKGRYFASLSAVIPNIPPKTYIGTAIMGESKGGITVLPKIYINEGLILFAQTPDLGKLLIKGKTDEIDKEKEKGSLIEGSWWDIDEEPEPFSTINTLAKYLGKNDETKGIAELLKTLNNELKKLEDIIHIGLRFPGRRREKDWQMLRLRRKDRARVPVLKEDVEEFKERLSDYVIEAVYQEYITEEYFHLRNKGRADRSILKGATLSIIGCGALGSETADALSKAGVGQLILVDKETMKAHNAVRHCLGINRTGFHKSFAMGEAIYLHNPFVKTETFGLNILFNKLGIYLPEGAVGISTIADDNVEAYLNEEAVTENRTVFYCRGLRGGKAARIYRVIPHNDACKTCLSLYRQDENPSFIDIEEDENLPAITNECNNPVRPASAADIKAIAGIFSRIIIDYLQGTDAEKNHWIWTTEALEGLKLENPMQGSLFSWNIPPHPNCPTCQKLEEKKVYMLRGAYEFAKKESSASKDIETGGMLLGYRAGDGKYMITKSTGPGPKAVRTAARFEKDTEYCQGEIEKTFIELGEKGLYLGEWHYHIIGGNSPSGIDIKSLTEIAEQENYRIDKPIMVIFSPALECAITIHDKTGQCVKLPIQVLEREEETESR
jgi:integrative and conjugative element protein (TIGR02256 family)